MSTASVSMVACAGAAARLVQHGAVQALVAEAGARLLNGPSLVHDRRSPTVGWPSIRRSATA
eukprot:5403290-Prymnesium_polylepis.2